MGTFHSIFKLRIDSLIVICKNLTCPKGSFLLYYISLENQIDQIIAQEPEIISDLVMRAICIFN